VPIPETERLTSALGTHFQQLQLSLSDPDAIDKIKSHSEARFWKQGFHFLVTFADDDSTIELHKALGSIISESEAGVIVNVLYKAKAERASELVKSQDKPSPRLNVVLADSFERESEGRLEIDEDAIQEVRECFERFRGRSGEECGTASGNRSLADLLLFLVSSLGEQVDRALVTANGSWRLL
jgi:hypothetical protein